MKLLKLLLQSLAVAGLSAPAAFSQTLPFDTWVQAFPYTTAVLIYYDHTYGARFKMDTGIELLPDNQPRISLDGKSCVRWQTSPRSIIVLSWYSNGVCPFWYG